MGAAWENPKVELLIGVPNTNLVTIHWALNFGAMWRPERTIIRAWSGLPIDVARNACAKEACTLGAKWLLFLDSDVIPKQRDWIKLLMESNEPIISALYWSKKGHPGMWIEKEEGGYTPAPRSGNSILSVDAVGAGALLIDTRVFKELDKLGYNPYFVWEVDDPRNIADKKSEDFHFCKLCRKAGFSILVNQSVEMVHEQGIAWAPEGDVAQFND
jgi:hypothetical protein